MTEPEGRQALDIARAVLRTLARALWRGAVYLGPLLLAVAIYAWRWTADVGSLARLLWLRRQKRNAPDRAADVEPLEQQLHEKRAARWATWRALPTRRRIAVRTAAIAVLVVVFAMARARYVTSSPTETPDTAEYTPAPVASEDLRASTPEPTVDLAAAAARFATDSRAAAPGAWSFLKEGPVLPPGPRGEFDDFIVASPWVLREVEGGATRYRMWYRGCYFRGRDRGCAIGHATSADGIRWQKSKGPVLQLADPSEGRRLHGVTVVRAGDRYFMWYSVRPELFGPRQPSTLHLATSADGLRWEAAGQVLASTERSLDPMEPSALHDGHQFHLWFLDSLLTFDKDDYQLQPGAPFLMHFTSADGRTWQESGRFPWQPTGLDRLRAVVGPRRGGGFQTVGLARNQYVRLESSDGNDWEMDGGAATTVEPRSLSDDVWYVTDATALDSEGGTLVWFVTKRQIGREEIRVGFRKAS